MPFSVISVINYEALFLLLPVLRLQLYIVDQGIMSKRLKYDGIFQAPHYSSRVVTEFDYVYTV